MAKTVTPKPTAAPPKAAKACPGCGDLTFDDLCVACRRKGGEKVEPKPLVRPGFDSDDGDAPPMQQEQDEPAEPQLAKRVDADKFPLCRGKGNTCTNRAADGICGECQREAAREAEPAPLPADQVKMIRSDVPMLRTEGGHFSDRLDGALTPGQVRNLRGVTDGLRAKMATLSSGRPVVSGLDAVKWWLESLPR